MNKDLNIDFKELSAKLARLVQQFKKYSLFIAILVVLSVYLFLVWQIRSLATAEPSSADVLNKVNELNTPRLDEDSVNRILQLEDQNVEVQTLFNDARRNPFQE